MQKNIKKFFKNKNILITGGTGSFGRATTEYLLKTDPKKMKDFLRHHHAIGRLGLANEISPWVLFLCSKYSTKFSTGSIINIDGGTM